MLLVWILTAIFQSIPIQPFPVIWNWFGLHPIITILLILIFA